MTFTEEEKKALIEASRSAALREDMAALRAGRHNPFIRDGKADPDAYVEFVTQYNEFINHRPKPFTKLVEKVMRL